MLTAIGVKTVFEADDGTSGLDAIRKHMPDLFIVDWEMPMIDGAQFIRMVRSPGEFPVPDIPIIVLSGHGDRWYVVEAARMGAREYLLKPVSTKALLDGIVAIIGRPCPIVTMNCYYGPAPRRLVVLEDKKVPDRSKPPESGATEHGLRKAVTFAQTPMFRTETHRGSSRRSAAETATSTL
jgi:DNA-binding NarL/FixJ family response regulator